MDKCKRCGIKTALSAEDIEKMVGEVTSMRGVRLADENTYGERFSVCEACDNFLYGSTCAVCGCVVQVRARLMDGRCPKKKWN